VRIKPFGIFLLIVLIAGAMYGVFYFSGMLRGQTPVGPANAPAQNLPGSTNLPVNPGNPSLPVVPGEPGVVSADGKYPVECHEGTTLTQLDVWADGYPGYYPLLHQVATMSASDKYCINLYLKFTGPNYDQHGWEEYQIEQMLSSATAIDAEGNEVIVPGTTESDGSGAAEIYFGTNGGLSLFDSRSGVIGYSPSGSTNADQIWALDSVASPFAKDGKPSFNDAFGHDLITSQGGADHFLAIRMMQLVGLTTSDVNIIFPQPGTGNPVDNFCAGNGQFVAYWSPLIEGASCQPATLLLSTGWWKGAVTDYIIISHFADTHMEDAVFSFLVDYNNATQAFTVDNLPATAQVLVNMQYEGNNLADWMFLDVGDPAGSLAQLMNGVAIAKLSDNAIVFDSGLFGSSMVEEQFTRAHNTWLYGGVTSNGNGNALFDVDAFVSDKYVKMLLKANAHQAVGTFSNTYDTDVSQTPPEGSTALIELPDWGTLPYKQIQFKPTYSCVLLDGEKEKVVEMAAAAAVLLNESDDAVLAVRGGMGSYTNDPDQLRKNKEFAYKRAQCIQKLLADELNIPIQRIILDTNVLVPDREITEADYKDYVVVIVSMKNTQFK
jgi:hypothetical protein